MNLIRVLALLKKEFRQMIRDRLNFFMLLIMPLLQLVLFGFAVETDVRHLPTVVWDGWNQSESRELIKTFETSTYFQITHFARTLDEVEELLAQGEVKAGLVISPYSTDKLDRKAHVWVLADGTDAFAALAAMKGAQWAAVGETRKAWDKQRNFWQNGDFVPIQIEFYNRYNPQILSTYTMIPGLLGLILTMTMVMVTSMALVREREMGTWEQLRVTPLTLAELFAGKILPYLLVGYIQLALALSAGWLLFDLPVAGSLVLLFSLTTLFLMASLALGILISTVAATQMQAMQMSFLIFLPSVLLSGFLFPREAMPTAFQWLGQLLPLTYYLEILRGVLLKGIGLAYLWGATSTLVAFATALFGLSFIKIHGKGI